MRCQKVISRQNKTRHRNAKKLSTEILCLKYCIPVPLELLIRSEHFIVTLSFLNYSEKSKQYWKNSGILTLWRQNVMGAFPPQNIDACYVHFKKIISGWSNEKLLLSGNSSLVPAPSVQGKKVRRKYCCLKMASAALLFPNSVSLRDVRQISPIGCDEITSWTWGMTCCEYNKVNVASF